MTNLPICYIAGALPLPQNFILRPTKTDLVIAADGGHLHLAGRNIVPNLVVGDFDSSTAPIDHPDVTRLPVEKDDTDMGYAIKLGLERGYQNFVLLGGLGGLLDHTMANLQHLHHLSIQGCGAILVGDTQCATVLTNGSLSLAGTPGDRCSLFSSGGEAEGVTLKNLYYNVEDITLSPSFPLGVSNSFTQNPACISVQQGSLLIIWENRDPHITTSFFIYKED